MATPLEVKQVWTALITMYPYYPKERSPNELKETLKLYQGLLADVPGEALLAAARQHMATNKFFPTPSELRTPAKALDTPAQLTALEAWGKVLDTFASGEYYFFESGFARTPSFDPLTQRVLDAMGGYWNVARSENQIADRARFIEGYNEIARRQEADRLILPEVRAVREKLLAEARAPVVKALTGGNHGNNRD